MWLLAAVLVAASACATTTRARGTRPESTTQSTTSSTPATTDPGSAPTATAPTETADVGTTGATSPGLVPITSPAGRAAAEALIAKLTTAGRGPKTGYARAEFGSAWTDDNADQFGHNGCDTRNDVLRRDLTQVTTRAGTHGCVVISGVLDDPYTGRRIVFTKSRATAVQIDHVAPLAYDWQMGAAAWPPAKRIAIANDPLNLLAVDGPTNEAKGDSGPASWLPPNKAIRCAYVTRFAAVALRYAMPVTAPDKTAAAAQCR